jgi:hypothetical protein
MTIGNDENYQKVRKKVVEFLKLPSTKKMLDEYRDKNEAKTDLKKHLYLLYKTDLDDIQKALDELLKAYMSGSNK